MIYSLLSFLHPRYEKFEVIVKLAVIPDFSAGTVLIFQSKSPMLCLFVGSILRGRQTLSRNTLPRYAWATLTILTFLFFTQHSIVVVDDLSNELISVLSRKTTSLPGHVILSRPGRCSPYRCTATVALKMYRRHTSVLSKMSILSHGRLSPRLKSSISMQITGS